MLGTQGVDSRDSGLGAANQIDGRLCGEAILHHQLGNLRLQLCQRLVDLVFEARLGLGDCHSHLAGQAIASYGQDLPTAIEQLEVVKASAGTPHQG